MSSARRTQREEWIQFLQAISFFDNIPILSMDRGDYQSDYLRAMGANTVLNGKIGLCVIVLSAKLKPTQKAATGPVVDFLHGAFVIENVAVNRDASMGTMVTREECSEKIIAYTHNRFRPSNASGYLEFEEHEIIEPKAEEADKADQFPYEICYFKCPQSALSLPLDFAAKPGITSAVVLGVPKVTMTCATPGAAIFYSVNGTTRPSPNNSLYLTTFSAVSGDVIVARAWLAGKLTSDAATYTIP